MTSEDYEIVSVVSTEAPDRLEGADWHRYTIAQGDNMIYGYRQGSLSAVTRSVEELVLRLNERRFGKKGRTQIYMPTRGKPGAAR